MNGYIFRKTLYSLLLEVGLNDEAAGLNLEMVACGDFL